MREESFVKFTALENVEHAKKKRFDLPYAKLNSAIEGIHKGDLILLESRPGMGTTTLCINLAVQLARNKYKVAYISLDHIQENISLKIEKCFENSNQNKESEDIPKTMHVDELEIYISNNKTRSDFDILVEMQEMVSKCKIDLFILDYVQLIKPTGDSLSNSDQDIRDYIQSFKHAIRKFNSSLIVVSKLTNRVDREALVPPGNLDCNIDWSTDVVIVMDRLEMYGCRQDLHGNSTENKFYLMTYKNKYGKEIDIGDKYDYYVDFEKQFIEEI